MPGTPTPLTDFTEGTVIAADDWLYMVDTSVTTDGTAGSSRKIQAKYWAQTNGSAAVITNGGTIALGGYTATVPGTGTLVTTSGTAVLSNKTFSDDVGVGAGTPEVRLHVLENVDWPVSILIENPNAGGTAHADLILRTQGPEQAVIRRYSPNAPVSGNDLHIYNSTVGDISLITAGGTVTLTDAGALNVSGGVVFDNEALDTYDTGTWTPVITGSSSNPTVGYSSQVGRYTRIGDTVFYSIFLVTSSISGGAGNVRISLPGTVGASSGDNPPGAVVYSGPTSTARWVVFSPAAGAAYGNLTENFDHAASTSLQVSELIDENNGFVIGGHYYV